MNKYSKKLAYLLRHDNTYSFDRFGWRSVVDLILNHHYTRMELETIVLNDDKLRFEFSDDMNHIRACQGHSIEVDGVIGNMSSFSSISWDFHQITSFYSTTWNP